MVEFDFLGKDSMRYENVVEVNKKVFKNLGIFLENKKEGDQLFDRLDTGKLNIYLKSLMPGLTAKVFRTYNASTTLEAELQRLTEPGASQHELIVRWHLLYYYVNFCYILPRTSIRWPTKQWRSCAITRRPCLRTMVKQWPTRRTGSVPSR